MNTSPKSLQGKTESDLAGYQVRQVGNTCSFHAITTAILLLLNFSIDPVSLSYETNRLWWRGRFLRVAPDWAVTPRMQVRIVRYLARMHDLPIAAAYQRGNPDTLPELLSDPDAVPIITIIWRWHKAPPIYLGNTTRNFNNTSNAGGHSMILAAFDPHHSANDKLMTPWGFINTWKANTNQLFWMTDDDFRRAWRFWLPGIGPNPVVTIRRNDPSVDY